MSIAPTTTDATDTNVMRLNTTVRVVYLLDLPHAMDIAKFNLLHTGRNEMEKRIQGGKMPGSVIQRCRFK